MSRGIEDDDTRSRAKQQILHHVLTFCLTRRFGGGSHTPGITAFVSDDIVNSGARPGDLVVLQSAPSSKWTIGWLRGTERDPADGSRHLIESLDDGELCWWSNVGIVYLDREVVATHPEWRWTDPQWALADRWKETVGRKGDPLIRYTHPEYGEGNSVRIGTYVSHVDQPIIEMRDFPDWRRITKKALAATIASCNAESDRILGERAARRKAGRTETSPGGRTA